MDDDTIIQILKEVKDDAAELALATIDLQFPDLSKGDRDAMRSALEVAAVPHWFNEEILANLLDCTSVESAPLIVRLRQLSVVETFTARGPGAVNLHETTRLALRARLKRMPFGSIGDSVQTKTSNRLAAISSRARRYFGGEDDAELLESLYHCFTAAPEEAAVECRAICDRCLTYGEQETLLALGVVLEEVISIGLPEGAVRATAHDCLARIRYSTDEREGAVREAKEALVEYEQIGVSSGIAGIQELLGNVFRDQGELPAAVAAFQAAIAYGAETVNVLGGMEFAGAAPVRWVPEGLAKGSSDRSRDREKIRSGKTPVQHLHDWRVTVKLRDRLIITTLVCDSLVIVYAVIFTYWIRFQTALSEFGPHPPPSLREYSGYIALASLTLILTLTSSGIYERNALLRLHFVSLQIIKASFLWAAGFLSFVLMFLFEPPISRLFIVIAAIVTPGGLLGWRWLFYNYLSRSPVATSLRQRIVFVGWNEEADRLTRTFASDPVSAYVTVGCVSAMRTRFQRKPGVRILGTFSELADVIHRYSIDVVILTDVNVVKGNIVSLANTCEREMVKFKVIPSYVQILVSGLHLDTVSGIPVLAESRLPLDRLFNILLKRGVDIVGSIVGLQLSLPLLAVFGALVYWESPGPILYRQRRLGRNGIEFDMLKIRSMKLDAEVDGEVGWTKKNDPRRLKIGAFMRRWNIDEVPQFWNVLKGDMSLVGPRPERPTRIGNFEDAIPHYYARLNVKPGITGWAQVKGLSGDPGRIKQINCELWYLENWSLLLDLQIMVMAIFKNDNAY